MPSVTVERGDTLSAIARRAGVSLGSLLAVNPGIADPNLIRPGQEVNIPGGRERITSGEAQRQLSRVFQAPSVPQMAESPIAPPLTPEAERLGLSAPTASRFGGFGGPRLPGPTQQQPSGTGITVPRFGGAPGAFRPGPAPAGIGGIGSQIPRQQEPRSFVNRPPGAAPGVGPFPAPPPVPATRGEGQQTQPSQLVSPFTGRSVGRDVEEARFPSATSAQLDHLDQLRAVDPERALEVARFQSATIGRADAESQLATNVFFTEHAIFDQGVIPRHATERVWDIMAQRLNYPGGGEKLLEDMGYVPIGGGLYFLPDQSPSIAGAGGAGGRGGGGRAIRNRTPLFSGRPRFSGQRGAGFGLVMWRIGVR